MKFLIARAWFVLALVALLTGFTTPADAEPHRLALQISDNTPQKMQTVLNVASNVSRHYSELGEEVEIKIIAFNLGLHMLRSDTAPAKVQKRIKGFSQSMPNVSFHACGNTMTGMARKEGKEPPLMSNAEIVPAGVITLMELDQKGWTIVRP